MPEAARELLQIHGLDSFYGAAHILHGVDLEVPRGETVALLGRNGAGKSTLMKSVIGLVRQRRGSIRFKGAEILGLPIYHINRLGIGYVPEERRIFTNLTVSENLEVGRRTGGAAVCWPLERVFDVFPNLKKLMDRMAGEMSGGEQQMLTVARTIMGNPELVLLDEPSEGLAPLIIEQMTEMIRRLQAEGLSILLSEQNMYFAGGVSQRAYIIERGVICFSGTMRQVMDDGVLRRSYLAV